MEMYASTPQNSSHHVLPFSWMISTESMCVFLLNFALGLPVHGYVTWLIVRGRSEIIIFNISVCEMLNALNCLFFVLSFNSSRMVLIFSFLQGVSVTARPLFQCLMCVERFLAVVHPVTFLKLKPLRYRIFCCSVAWTITFASCLFSLFTVSADDMASFVWFYIFQFLMFLPIQMFCCVSVLRALKQSGPGERKEENLRKSRAFYLILITSLNLMVLYLPFTVIGFLMELSQSYIQQHWFSALVVYTLASFTQPVVYLHRLGKLSCICPP